MPLRPHRPKEAVVGGEARRPDGDVGETATLARRLDGRVVEGARRSRAARQRALDGGLHGARREVQDADVLDVRAITTARPQGVVGAAERQRGEQSSR